MAGPEPLEGGGPSAGAAVERPQRVATAYDAIAADYDRLVREDAWMRRRLWAHYLGVFERGARLLDVGCGTGLDTLALAARGRRMTAVDVSPGMVEELRRKAAALGLLDRIEVHVGDAAALGGWPAASFDGILSSFAGLNTVDLGAFAAAAARLLRRRRSMASTSPPASRCAAGTASGGCGHGAWAAACRLASSARAAGWTPSSAAIPPAAAGDASSSSTSSGAEGAAGV
jgi:SAM-dependent methyltransferase